MTNPPSESDHADATMPTNGDVKRMLHVKAAQRPGKCPICGSELVGAVSTLHDRECFACGTKFTMRPLPESVSEKVDADAEAYFAEPDMDTTPVRRLKLHARQQAYTSAAMKHLAEESNDDAE